MPSDNARDDSQDVLLTSDRTCPDEDVAFTASPPAAAAPAENEQHAGCMERSDDVIKSILAGVPLWVKGALTLTLHIIDWGSDVAVTRQWYSHGHYWWASLNVAFVVAGGLLGAVIAYTNGVRGGRLSMYVLGLGPIVEAVMNPKIFEVGVFPATFIIVRGCETFAEAIPSGALQVYVLVRLGHATFLQKFSACISVVSAGYGCMAVLRDWDPALGTYTRGISRKLLASASLLVFISCDFMWRVLPLATFMADPSFRPWSITVVGPLVLAFEMALMIVAEERTDFNAQALGSLRWVMYIVGGLATGCSAALWVQLVLAELNKQTGRLYVLWGSHIFRSALSVSLLVLVHSRWVICLIAAASGATATIALGMLSYVKHVFDLDPELVNKTDAERDLERFEENDVLCFCW